MILLPDVERLVATYLRAHADVVALVGDRVYTAFPAQAGGECLVLLQRFGGSPPLSRPLVVDEAQMQVDAYGGTKAQAHEVLVTVLAALAELPDVVTAIGHVSNVGQGARRYLPDETFTPHRPRYVADLTLTTRPAAAPLGAHA